MVLLRFRHEITDQMQCRHQFHPGLPASGTSPSGTMGCQKHQRNQTAANSHLLDSHTVVPEQSATTQGGQYQYLSHPSVPSTSAQGYSDVSHLFPDGKIPPPPPRLPPPGASASPQPLLNASKPDTVVSPAIARPQISINNKAPGAYSQGSEWQNQEQSSSTQPTPASGNDWEHTAGTKVFATNTTTYNIGNDGARVTSAAPEAIRLSANNDIAAVNEGFQTMRLENSSRETPLSTEDSNNSKYRAYSPQQASSPAPAIPAKIPFLTPQSPNHRSATPDASSATSPRQSQSAGRECISSNVTFAATWYTHRRAPEFSICMNCYENHIQGSRFKAEFQGMFLDDGKVRACAFNSTRIKERLWKLALSSGSLDSLVE
ncbi:hypothetical protein NUW58_g10327 [Xylaria curta]|uniref:Uncharacterized protein n=1 Tax=Xylaria curta TaxID=42375 RepID=A0ACC1MMB8_9PEZI|nr:hypothetical protein NUW58_g10327 [Xylaria curta]